ncbi:hypothetical protein GGE65_004035 [Skermanella aerolata]|jgi:hypothetical protein|uniref:Uncharacterized protein n=1 Tax=Skermanella aerolata TaxID=393310 RepID=A0A512DKB3_9PROT|nr:hypothetical protein [Skermanella aerolata]KJB97227.1 hypothetical protein N826_29955 [Skermanella aerolata KACC 11604]GEO36630.1 hypothetical protein SAE02_07780 [Skermanella aerolata]
MKTSGLLLSCVGFAGLIVATAIEIGMGSGLLRAINYGFATEIVGGLMDHRTAIVLVSGFAFVAGAILYGFSVTEAALARMTAMIGEAIDAPDTCPAMPLLLDRPAAAANSSLPAPVDLSALRPAAGVRMTASENPVELTAMREGGARGA